MNTPRLPGSRWFGWLRNFTLRVGFLTGVHFSVVFVAWLLVANRVPLFEEFAGLRNSVAMGVFGVVMLIPVVCFLRQPLRLFGSGLLGWLLFALVYDAMGFFFPNLHARLKTPFHIFALGAVVYGLVAVVAWVAAMALEARHQPAIASRRRSS